MKIEDLTKTQLILLALLVSFVSSIVVGITVVRLMDQSPEAVPQTINRIVQHTIEKVSQPTATKTEPLSKDQEKLLQDLKDIKPLTVSLYKKGEKEDMLLGTGLFFGESKVIIGEVIPEPKEGEVYTVRSILGERKITKLTAGKDFTIIELAPTDDTAPTDTTPTNTTPTPPETTAGTATQ